MDIALTAQNICRQNRFAGADERRCKMFCLGDVESVELSPSLVTKAE